MDQNIKKSHPPAFKEKLGLIERRGKAKATYYVLKEKQKHDMMFLLK